MIISATKYCDICNKAVARKATLLYHTINPYVTLRTDDPVTYANMESNTTSGKLHICRDCFKKISLGPGEIVKEYREKAAIKLAQNARSDYWHWIDDTLYEVEKEMVGENNV